MARAFAEYDYARIGVVGRDEFREILNKYTVRCNDEQVSHVFVNCTTNISIQVTQQPLHYILSLENSFGDNQTYLFGNIVVHLNVVFFFQFEKLWTTVTVNEFNNVDYRDFLQTYCARGAGHHRSMSRAGSRPATSMSIRPGSQMNRSAVIFQKNLNSKGSFTFTVNVTVFVSGTFNLFKVMCK